MDKEKLKFDMRFGIFFVETSHSSRCWERKYQLDVKLYLIKIREKYSTKKDQQENGKFNIMVSNRLVKIDHEQYYMGKYCSTVRAKKRKLLDIISHFQSFFYQTVKEKN